MRNLEPECHHSFCDKCIIMHIPKFGFCPMCRVHIPKVNLVRILKEIASDSDDSSSIDNKETEPTDNNTYWDPEEINARQLDSGYSNDDSDGNQEFRYDSLK